MNRIKIGNKHVGPKDPCLIMVDAGVNHNNDPKRALDLIKKAAESGADVVKFQTYKAKSMATRVAERYWNPKLDTDGGGTQFETFARIDGLPQESYKEMRELANELNVILSSTPFGLDDVDVLDEIDMDMFKIASADLVFDDLLAKVGERGKPVILSTGCSSLSEIEHAMNILTKKNCHDIILQHCILSYPCDDEDANLVKMVKIQEVFCDTPVGYSDHTYGLTVPLAAIAMGARSIEKHYTVDKGLPDSPDHSFSMDPDELASLVHQRDRIEASFGHFFSGPYPAEGKAVRLARKSVVSDINIKKGVQITKDMITWKRPGTGISPKETNYIIGRVAKQDIPEDTTLTWEMFV